MYFFLLSRRSDGVPLSGESPARQDFPRQSHRVDARRDFSRVTPPTMLGNGDEIATAWARNVISHSCCYPKCAACVKCAGTVKRLFSRCAQQKPLANRDCPRQAGAFDDSLDGRSYNTRYRPLQYLSPAIRDPRLNAGSIIQPQTVCPPPPPCYVQT